MNLRQFIEYLQTLDPELLVAIYSGGNSELSYINTAGYGMWVDDGDKGSALVIDIS